MDLGWSPRLKKPYLHRCLRELGAGAEKGPLSIGSFWICFEIQALEHQHDSKVRLPRDWASEQGGGKGVQAGELTGSSGIIQNMDGFVPE